MKRGFGTRGFTVVEVVIVMAVTGALLVSAMLVFSGKQADVQFNQAINDVQSQVNQIINNVQTGYYTRPVNFQCTPGLGPSISQQQPNIVGGTNELGTNAGCTFVGRAIHFGVGGTNLTGFNVYNLVGRQLKYNTTDNAASLTEANPIAMPVAYEQKNTLQYGLRAVSMHYGVSGGPVNNTTGIVVIMSSFGQVTDGGSTTTKMYAMSTTSTPTPSSLNQSDVTAVNQINVAPAANLVLNTSAVTICFDGGTKLLGILTIGSYNRQLTTSLKMANRSPTPSECP